MEAVRDRIKELRRVPASALAPHPKNWRTHPAPQREVLSSLLADIGYAGALLARETPDGLVLIDGHLRRDLTPEQEVPVLVLDVTEAEADRLLASYDPVAAMAGVDAPKLQALMEEVNLTGPLEEFLGELAADPSPLPEGVPVDDPAGEWRGMPEFEHEDQTSHFRAIVHFASEADVRAFEGLVGQKIPANTRAIWYPKAERQVVKGSGYVSDEP